MRGNLALDSFDVIKGKCIRDGKVAVLVSPGYGAGWYTWHFKEDLLFDPVIVQMVLENRKDDIEDYCLQKYTSDDNFYPGGIEDLIVMWVPIGARFRIEEYDGSESLKLETDYKWVTA